METHSSSRAEAERWLVIAEKLLTTRDLVGSKTFAIRAKDSGLSLDSANRILAVADTLLAGEKRVNNHHDWYAILQLGGASRDSELIATQYRRLALLLNPIRNKLAFAVDAFKLVSDAWSVLSNPSKKSLYDNELNLFTTGSDRVHQEQFQQNQNANRNPRNSSDVNVENNVTEEADKMYDHDETSSFWTACPYCYTMYEYPRVYEDCTLRCQKCRRAFHAVVISSPPPICDGKEDYFCSWGFFPLGVSDSDLGKDKGRGSDWTPFSPMFTCPQVVVNRNVAAPKPKNVNVRKSSVPIVYIDDDQDEFVEISEASDDSDDEWGTPRKKKKAKNVKGKGSVGKNSGKQQIDKGKNVKVAAGGGGENFQVGSAAQEGIAIGVPNSMVAEASKKVVANTSTRKQMGTGVVRELGKLDLNVEFSNEVEEPVMGMNEGNGVEYGIEGTGFFEGLDEFLSSLPILSVVGDDKVKAA